MAPRDEAQTAFIIRNTFCGMRVSVPLPKFCKKNCFATQNLTKIGQLAAELWPKGFQYGGRPPF